MVKVELSRRGAIFLFLLTLLADQLSKRLVWCLFPKWIGVNTGMAWGLFTGRNGWWLGLSCLLLGVLFSALANTASLASKDEKKILRGLPRRASLFLALKMQKRWWLVALIWSGGVSNFIDRLVYGGVRDWLRVGWLPAFNLADLAITVGVIWLGLSFLRSDGGVD